MLWTEKLWWAARPVVCVWCLTQMQNTELVANTCHLSNVKDKPLFHSPPTAPLCLTATLGFIGLLYLSICEGLCVVLHLCFVISGNISTCFQQPSPYQLKCIYKKLNWTLKDLYVILYAFLCLQSMHILTVVGKKGIQHVLNILIICTNFLWHRTGK